MINIIPLLGAVAAGLLMGGGRSHGLSLGSPRTGRASRGLFNLMDTCYGNETERFKKWSARRDTADFANSSIVQDTINKGSWYDLKPEESSPTTSPLGRGIIEINRDAVEPPPLPEEPTPSEAPAPPDTAGYDEDEALAEKANPLEFLEVPDGPIEESFGMKCLRMIIAAAHSDGELHENERRIIESNLSKLPKEERDLAEAELSNPMGIDDICRGIDKPGDRQFIFGLAALTLRSDGKVTPEENHFIREAARALGLDKATAMKIINASRPGT